MNSMLYLKVKNDEHVVYRYSSDVADFGGKLENIVSDGEIEYSFKSEEFTTLKRATYDDTGFRAEWLEPHIWHTIFVLGCPNKRFVATG